MRYRKRIEALVKEIVQRDPTRLSRRLLDQLKFTYSEILSVYDGTGIRECPCCGYTGRFHRFGNPPRPGAMCPKCGSCERHRLLHLYLKNRTNIFSSDPLVLHLAPEACFKEIFARASNVSYVASDISIEASPLAMIQAEITRLPFRSGCFDAILCIMVLEHIQNDAEAMTELFRVLKPGGWAIVQVYIDEAWPQTFEDPSLVSAEERAAAFGQGDHVRIYGRDYKDRLEHAGFAVKVDACVKELPADIVERYGLDYTENVYFLTKKL